MKDNRSDIRVVTVLGTARPGNYTGKALALVDDELRRRGVEVFSVQPEEMTLGFPGEPESEDSRQLKEIVKGATGVVLATPEYHGSISSMMKLVIENLGFPSALSRKPVVLLGTASGQIGAIKSLEQLRSICSHVGAIVLPGPVSVAGVQKLFDEQGKCLDDTIEARIRGVAGTLLDYIRDHVCPRYALEEMAREQIIT